MMHLTLALLGALPLGFDLSAPSSGAMVLEAATDIEALVAEEAAAAASRSVDELWNRAAELRDAERLGEEGELDRALDTQLRNFAELSPAGVLLLAATRLQGDTPDPALLLHALQPLLETADTELGIGSAKLLGNPAFRKLPRKRRSDLVDVMLDTAEDVGRSPAYRLEFAKSAYRIGAGSARRKANAVMQSFLESADADLRAQGGLAMASATEREVEGAFRDVLERLAEVRDERGAVAAGYLKLEDERRYQEQKLSDVREQYGSGKELPEELTELVAVLNMIQERHLEGNKIDREELLVAAIDGMLHWMDQHSSYLPAKAFSKFLLDLEAEYGGIGAYVNDDPDSGLFTIVRPIYSGPAYRAGLMTDDKIVRIGDWPTLGESEEDIIKRLKGKPGTPVELYVWRRGMDPELIERPTEDMKVVIERAQIEIPAGSYQMLPGEIGLVELTTFSQKSTKQLEEWIPQLVDDGMRALVLDMRRNSGGLLNEARAVADLFLPRHKVVVQTQGRQRKPESLLTASKPVMPEGMPLIILTSRMTASAAEIVAGALKDHDRATLVGKRTFGKGSVQQLMEVNPNGKSGDQWKDLNRNNRWDPGEPLINDWDGDGEVDYAPRVKLTIARYLLPSGRSIHRELDRKGNVISEGGVAPDHEVDFPLIERWRYEEQRRIRGGNELKDYVGEHYEENHDLFNRLAVNDLKDPNLYPEFEPLYFKLATELSRDDVRRLLREEVRRRVQDDVGREFPWGDYVEDVQVQRAIQVALEQLGEDVTDVSEYGLVFELSTETQEDPDRVALVRPESSRSLRRARSLLEQARDGGTILTEESIGELLLLLRELEVAEEN